MKYHTIDLNCTSLIFCYQNIYIFQIKQVSRAERYFLTILFYRFLSIYKLNLKKAPVNILITRFSIQHKKILKKVIL